MHYTKVGYTIVKSWISDHKPDTLMLVGAAMIVSGVIGLCMTEPAPL